MGKWFGCSAGVFGIVLLGQGGDRRILLCPQIIETGYRDVGDNTMYKPFVRSSGIRRDNTSMALTACEDVPS